MFLNAKCMLATVIITFCGCMGYGLAGGSISWDEANLQIKKEDPFMSAYITKYFDVESIGDAIRVGSDVHGNSTVRGVGVGTRLPPYEFCAKPKNTSGNCNLHITINPSSDEEQVWEVAVRKKLKSD